MASSEILPLIKLLAKVAVDEYLQETKATKQDNHKENVREQNEQGQDEQKHL